MSAIHILAAVHPNEAPHFHQQLCAQENFQVEIVTGRRDALDWLDERQQQIDILIIDNRLGGAHQLLAELRQAYPRLLMILVDEGADFAMSGHANEISTAPFTEDDLVHRINRLMADRMMDTIHADTLPVARDIYRRLQAAAGAKGKREEAIRACIGLGYDYAAYYYTVSIDPLNLILQTQEGPRPILAVAPKKAGTGDLMGWVAQNEQSRIAGPPDDPNHPLVARGRLGAVACVPVSYTGRHFGVIVACRDRPDSISQEDILMLKLLAAQLGAMLSRETLI
jgi:hypothetical protein